MASLRELLVKAANLGLMIGRPAGSDLRLMPEQLATCQCECEKVIEPLLAESTLLEPQALSAAKPPTAEITPDTIDAWIAEALRVKEQCENERPDAPQLRALASHVIALGNELRLARLVLSSEISARVNEGNRSIEEAELVKVQLQGVVSRMMDALNTPRTKALTSAGAGHEYLKSRQALP